MRKILFVAAIAVSIAPAFAEEITAPDPIVVAQIQGPSVIRAPRYITNPNAEDERAPRGKQARNQRTRQYDAEIQQQQQPQPARYQQQPQPQQQAQYQYTQQPRGNLGGGFIEFLVTGNNGPRHQQQQPQQQQYQEPRYYYAPNQEAPPQHYQRQQPAYQHQYQQRPLNVARTDPQEQPAPRPIFDPRYERKDVEYVSEHPVGSIVIDTRTRYLYLIQPNGRAIRYGVGVGRPGFEWKGVKTVSAMKEWPDWRPPAEMRLRQPWLPEHMVGGPNNPLGARALYLGSSLYRIHGSNEPHTIGSAVSSGCFRMRNEDVIDLYNRVKVGTRVVVI
jgi:lipoprotein-anchoring transpeptidase ErfK/SrfK